MEYLQLTQNMDLTPITYEQVLLLFAENQKQFAETDKKIAEVALLIAATNEQLAATDKQLAATNKQLAATDKQLKLLSKKVDDVTDSLGRFAEEQVRPKIVEMFREKGIELEETILHTQVKKNGIVLLEIDLLLINSIYSVVVEVKNTLREKHVDDHIKRMEKLQLTPSHAIKGTTMYGAVAGMIMTKEVEDYALRKGFFVIKTKGDNVAIVENIKFKPKTWQVAS